jgi:hypothetical protein
MTDTLKSITKQGGETMGKRNLFKPEISQSTVDDLFNGTLIPRKTRPAALDGTGVIKRGTPLASDDGETFTVWEAGETIRAILLEDIDTSEAEEAANAALAISGEFNKNRIEEALGEEIDPEAVMEAWGRNIHIEANKRYPSMPDFPLG